jgi:hypothetical protein
MVITSPTRTIQGTLLQETVGSIRKKLPGFSNYRRRHIKPTWFSPDSQTPLL